MKIEVTNVVENRNGSVDVHAKTRIGETVIRFSTRMVEKLARALMHRRELPEDKR